MFVLILKFVLLAATIVVAGTFLARCADVIGDLTGMGRSLAGMVLLATATSMPELAVDCSAGYVGAVDLAMGDLLGSSLMNLLVLAVLDLLFRSRGRMLSRMAAAHALSATMSMVLTALCLLFLLWPLPVLALGVGPGGLVILAAYLLCLRLVYFDQRYSTESAWPEPVAEPVYAAGEVSLRRAVIGYLIAAAAIMGSGPLLAVTADQLAEASGLGGTFVGTTLVALCTSLPEVVTTLAAVRMGAFDLAVGNVFGSNSFNMTILPAIDLFYDGSLFAAVSSTHAVTATAVIIVTATATLGLLYRAEKRYWLIEPDAALVLLMVVGALGLVYHLK